MEGMSAPPPPPLPSGRVPATAEVAADDGWVAVWEQTLQAYYFSNSRTGETTWRNPRLEPQEKGAGEGELKMTGTFNRATGKWQGDPERAVANFTVKGKAFREMSKYFDVDGTSAAHDGRSLRAERAAMTRTLPKKQMQKLKKEYKEKKEERRRGWLMREEDPRERAKRLAREKLMR